MTAQGKPDTYKAIFAKLHNGDTTGFFEHVDDHVDWTVMGTHPLAGRYHSKEDFFKRTFQRLDKLMQGSVQLNVQHLHFAGDTVIAELASAATTRDGQPFDNVYCWVCRFVDDRIVEVRAYIDSALVQATIDRLEHAG